MNHYIMIRRLRFPAILLLIGVIALLHQTGVVDHFWHWFLPLLLMLAERAALATDGGYPGSYPGQPGPDAIDPRAATGVGPYPGQPAAYIPDHLQDSKKDSEGRQI
jgi:hypothetical protein